MSHDTTYNEKEDSEGGEEQGVVMTLCPQDQINNSGVLAHFLDEVIEAQIT